MPAQNTFRDSVHRDRAIADRNRGIATGKSAKGWSFKRHEAEPGTFERMRAEAKAMLRNHFADVLEDYQRAAHPERYEVFDVPF